MEIFLHKKDMPNCCEECKFCNLNYDKIVYYCALTEYMICVSVGDNHEMSNRVKGVRHSTCPLKPLNESELTPKYKKGDKVYFITEGQVCKGKITSAYYGSKVNGYTIKAPDHLACYRRENMLWDCKDEAHKTLDEWLGRDNNANL